MHVWRCDFIFSPSYLFFLLGSVIYFRTSFHLLCSSSITYIHTPLLYTTKRTRKYDCTHQPCLSGIPEGAGFCRSTGNLKSVCLALLCCLSLPHPFLLSPICFSNLLCTPSLAMMNTESTIIIYPFSPISFTSCLSFPTQSFVITESFHRVTWNLSFVKKSLL